MDLISSCEASSSPPVLEKTLQLLIHRNDAAKVKLLIGRGCSVNQAYGKLAHGNIVTTPLQKAVLANNTEIAGILLDHGAEVDHSVGNQSTVLMMAAGRGFTEVVKYIIHRNANINLTSSRLPGSALHAAIEAGSGDTVSTLLDASADVNITGGIFGESCSPLQGVLHSRSLCSKRELAKRLIDQGADVNATNEHFGSSLQLTAGEGHLSIVQLLLNRGADVDRKGGFYGSALQAAAAKNDLSIVQLLLDHRANVDLVGGCDNGTALQFAAANGHLFTVQLLLDHGADVHLVGRPYGSALQAAARYGHLSIVQLLLDRGADVHLRGGPFGNALGVALQCNQEAVAMLLRDHGAVPPRPRSTSSSSSSRSGWVSAEESFN